MILEKCKLEVVTLQDKRDYRNSL